MKVAIQGELGAFSHEAAERMLPRCTVVPCARSAEVFERVERGSVAAAVIPIENTLAGTVAEHADLLLTRECVHSSRVSAAHRPQRDRRAGSAAWIVAASAVASGGARSVPRLFSAASEDRSGAVLRHGGQREARDREPVERCGGNRRTAGGAGICGKILESSIEDDKRNFTRFFLIRKLGRGRGKREKKGSTDYHRLIPRGANKTSIVFQVKNVPGALFKSLSVFALRDISLSKIESRPMRGRPWEYVFYVDFLRGDDEPARNALRHLGEVAEFVKVLGVYPAVSVRWSRSCQNEIGSFVITLGCEVGERRSFSLSSQFSAWQGWTLPR